VRLVFTPQGWDDCVYWQTRDRAVLKRINRLLQDALRDPTVGIGKPEQLKYGVSGAWSRRIKEEHRLVYIVRSNDLVILQARYRYSK
jgi:toxin YoeB